MGFGQKRTQMPPPKVVAYNWSQTTSSHGIPHIGRAKSVPLKIFWSCIFVVALSLMVWQVTLLLQKFLDFDKVTKMELRFKERPFPAVTICNLNPYNYPKIEQSTDANMEDIKAMLALYVEAKNSIGDDDYINLPGRDAELTKFRFNGSITAVSLTSIASENLMFMMSNLPVEDRRLYSYSLNDLVSLCTYSLQDCRVPNDFVEHFDPNYGLCWTFNWMKVADAFPTYVTSRAGPLYGLRIIVFSRNDTYLPMSEASGVRITVHNQTEYPFLDSFGFNAATGYATSFGISYREIERMGPPYGDCTDTAERDSEAFMGTYTMEGCFRECLQRKLNENCTCGDPRYQSWNASADRLLCDLQNLGCYSNFISNNVDQVSGCGCPQPCMQGNFDITMSSSRWPSGSYLVPGCAESAEECTEDYMKNAAMLEVYYEQLNYRYLKESAAYTWVNLVSDFGGQAGLWLGVSVVTGVEVIVLMCQIICKCCYEPPPDELLAESEKKKEMGI